MTDDDCVKCITTQPEAYHDQGECEICDKLRGPLPEPTEDR
jgi:hypothetical protein